MEITSFLPIYTGLSRQTLFGSKPPLVKIARDGSGNITFPVWNVLNLLPPTAAEITAALAALEPVSELANVLALQASACCATITSQIVPDQTHQNAYNLAASIVMQSGGAAPTSGPLAASFAALAQSQGYQPAAFATLVIAVINAGMALSAALGTLETAAAASTTPSGLATALTAFETGVTAVVTSITAAGLMVAGPAAISITGINA